MELAFRLHNNGDQIVVVAFPEEGGEAILRKSWNLETVDLRCINVPDRRNLPHGEHKIPNRKSLVRGGFDIQLDHERELITVTPLTRQGNMLETRSELYRFEDLGVESLDEYRNRSLKASLDRLPLK